jgi:hypothetical protein
VLLAITKYEKKLWRRDNEQNTGSCVDYVSSRQKGRDFNDENYSCPTI